MFSSSTGKPSPGEGKVVVDTSAAPLLRVRMVGSPSTEAFEAYLREMAALIRRGPYASIYDARQSNVSRASHRKRQADWIRENLPVIRQNCAGVAFCASSPLVRGAITAVFWLQ
ncbi:MAG TPA: hypothetical protein VFS00_08915, partial [Polyangiaceae bacterium]|nr:hypothetical protein [Polyangiaceae bacterium]